MNRRHFIKTGLLFVPSTFGAVNILPHRRKAFQPVAAAGGGTSVTDDFNRANESPLGGNWSLISNGHKVVSNQVEPIANDFCFSLRTETFAVDHSASIKQISSAGGFIGTLVRASGTSLGTLNCYGFYVTTLFNIYRFFEINNGTISYGSEIGATVAANDVWKLEASGTTMTLKRNGSTIDTLVDATHSGTKTGLFIAYNGTQGDDFAAADL